MARLRRFIWIAQLTIAFASVSNAKELLPLPPVEIGEDIISEAWIEPGDPDKAVHAIGGIEINASVSVIWEIMLDCEMAIQIASDIKGCEVLEKDESNTWDIRKQKVSVSPILPKFVTVFRSDYTHHRQIDISRVRGDLIIQDGRWVIEPLLNERTRVTYQARLKPKGPVPRALFRRAVDKDLPEILGNLRDLAESRFQSSKIELAP